MSASANSIGNERLARLDGLRGLAACVVAFGYHAGNLFTREALSGYGPLTDWTLRWGWTCVDLFFVISGFIFAHVYLKPGALAGGRALADFAVARFARLYPLHLLMLLATALAFWGKTENTLPAFLLNLGVLQVFSGQMGHVYVGPSWSLSVEVICYVIFALTAGLCRPLLMPVTWCAALGGAVWLLLYGPPGGPWAGDVIARGLFGFFTGQLLWHARSQMARVSWPVLAAALVFGIAANVGTLSPLLPLGLLAWPAALVLALRLPFMESAAMRWLGDRSYAIYLVHMPLIDWFLAHNGKLSGGAGTAALAFTVFVVVVLALSDLTLKWIETPARRAIRESWARRRPLRARLAPA